MDEYEFRHPLRTFRFTAQSDESARAVWFIGLRVEPDAAFETRLFRLRDEADITPSVEELAR